MAGIEPWTTQPLAEVTVLNTLFQLPFLSKYSFAFNTGMTGMYVPCLIDLTNVI